MQALGKLIADQDLSRRMGKRDGYELSNYMRRSCCGATNGCHYGSISWRVKLAAFAVLIVLFANAVPGFAGANVAWNNQ